MNELPKINGTDSSFAIITILITYYSCAGLPICLTDKMFTFRADCVGFSIFVSRTIGKSFLFAAFVDVLFWTAVFCATNLSAVTMALTAGRWRPFGLLALHRMLAFDNSLPNSSRNINL